MTDHVTTPEPTPNEAEKSDAPGGVEAGVVADSVDGNWVDRLAPVASRPYLRLSRADRPIGTWLLLLPCWWGILAAAGATGWRAGDIWLIIGCGLGAFLMRGAGCTWNDLTDHEFDAKVARTQSRPLPSGQVTRKQAQIWMVAQALVAFVILLTFGALAIWLGIASLVLVAIYPFAKRFTWWPQVFLGLAFNWGALLGWAAHEGKLSLAALFLYAGGITWTLFYDTIYAHQDTDDDALIGVKSTARKFGDASPGWLRLFMALTVLLLTVGMILALAPAGNPLALAIAAGGAWAMGWHMTWQLTKLNINDSEGCLELFRANKVTGLIPTVALALALMV